MARVVQMALLLAATALLSRSEEAQQPDSADNKLGLGPLPLNIDPTLRRALLQALTQLEQEAVQGVTANTQLDDEPDPTPTTAAAEDYPEEDGEPVEEQDDQTHVHFDSFSDDHQDFHSDQSDYQHSQSHESEQPFLDGNDSKQDTEEHPTGTVVDNQHNVDQAVRSETSVQTQESRSIQTSIDVQSNVIPSSSQGGRKPQGFKSVLPTVLPTVNSEENKNTVEIKSSISSTVKADNKSESTTLDKDNHEVSIFQAPLVAAFTLHHDEQGLPRSVVPLFRKQEATPVEQFQTFSRERELEHRTIQLQQQLLQVQQQQYQQQETLRQQQLLTEAQERQRQQQQVYQEEQQRLRQQQLYQEQQQQLQQQRNTFLQEEKIRQLQVQQQQQQRQILPQQQFFPVEQSQPRLRSQRQEQGTGIIDFQRSVDIPFRPPPPPLLNIQPSASFLISQRQQPFNTFSQNFLQQSQQFVPIQPQVQQYRTIFDQQPSVNVRTPFNNNANVYRKPPSVDSQLQSLLYQSGVAGDLHSNIRNGASPQEDLNIVSKVLSLNHEGRGGVAAPSRTGRKNQESYHVANIRHPSSVFTPPHF